MTQASLHNAYLGDADFNKAKNLSPIQVKSACYWQEAKYSSEFKEKLARSPEQEVNCDQ